MAAAVAIACCVWWTKKFAKSKPHPLPPGPPGLPILGNLPFIEPDFHRYVAKLSQIYGPIIKLQFGRRVCIIISSPSVAKEVLKDHDAIFANRDIPVAAMLGRYGGRNIVWTHNGPNFRKLRKLVVREIMSNPSLDAGYELRRGEIRKMVKELHGKVGSTVNLGEQIFHTTLNVMINMLWSSSLNGEEGRKLMIEFKKRLHEFVGLLGSPNVSDLFPLLTSFDLQGIQSKTKKILAWFYDNVFESVIVERTKMGEGQKNEEHNDFLQLLLDANQRGGDDKTSISMNEIKALLLDMLIGGSDTIPTTVEWAMTELLRHPDKMKIAVEELDTVVGNQNIVEESHLPRLPYVEAVAKETLRLHPAAPLLVPHMPSETCIVAGYTVPKHSRIFINAWAIQRDPEFWENPLRFEPERFLKDKERANYQGNNFYFFPFGSGRRICVGIPMAERMVGYELAVLLHSFDWKLPGGIMPDTKDKLGLVLSKAESLTAIPVARLSDSLLYQ
ncbi:hypothetical protein PTKIN_Ptkin05aG0143500 [Pterospermum kingtungense]